MSYASEQAVLNSQWNAAQLACEAETERARPSVLFTPRLYLDGNQYCALYGDDLMNGCGGFGNTPEAAMRNFDTNWREQKAPSLKSKATP